MFGITNATNASSGGTIFGIPAGTTTIHTIASFGDGNTVGANPFTILVDSKGNLFGTATANNSTGNEIWELPVGSSTIPVVYDSVQPLARGLSIDSAGDFFGYGSNDGSDFLTVFAFEYSQSAGYQSILTKQVRTGESSFGDLTNDPAGDAFLAYNDLLGTPGYIQEIPAGSSTATTVFTSSDVPNEFLDDLTTDSAGNIYMLGATPGSQTNSSELIKLSAGTNAVTIIPSIPDSEYTGGPVVDTAGDVYAVITQASGQSIVEVPAGQSAPQILVSYDASGSSFTELQPDAEGNLYYFGYAANVAGTPVSELKGVGTSTINPTPTPTPTPTRPRRQPRPPASAPPWFAAHCRRCRLPTNRSRARSAYS